MKIEKGYTRVVFVFSKVVIKLPRLLRNSKKIPTKVTKNWQRQRKVLALFENMVINLQEFIFFLIVRPKFCLPTYFSFFGLFNIQKKGEIITEQGESVYNGAKNFEANTLSYLLKNYSKELEEKNHKDSAHLSLIHHNIASPGALYFNKKRIQVADYGDWPVIRFIRKYKNELSENST